MFSGGAGFGKFHNGVIKALAEHDLLPKIICGSSAGSVAAAGLSTLKYDELDIISNHEICFGRKIMGWKADSTLQLVQDFF